MIFFFFLGVLSCTIDYFKVLESVASFAINERCTASRPSYMIICLG